MDDNDKKPVGEGIDEIEDNDDCEDSVQNPATPGNQAPSVQDTPENEEFPSGVSAETSSRSTAQNRNTNQRDDIFYSSRHLQIPENCSQLVDGLLSPRQHSVVLKVLSNDQSGFWALLSGAGTSSVSSSQNQSNNQLEEASNINAPVSNRQRQGVLSMLDTSAGTSSQTSVPTSVSQTTERSGSVLGESRDCVSPLQSFSARETTQIPQPGRKARKSFPSKSSLPKTITSSRLSFETGMESTSVKEAETERSDSESGPGHESFRSKPSPSAAEGTLCESRIRAQAREIGTAAQQDDTSEPLPQPGRKARKSFPSKSSLPKTITSSRRSFETGMEPSSVKEAETERADSDSGESGPEHESFRSKSSPSAAEGTLCESRIRTQAREIRIAAQQGDASEPLAGPFSSREREGTSSGSSERKRRKMLASGDEHSNEEPGSNQTSNEEPGSNQTSNEESGSNQTSNEESGSNQTSNEESSPSAAEGTSCDSPINAQVPEMGIAAQQDETSEPLSEALTPRKRGRISSGSGGNVDSRKQRKMLASGDEHSNEESGSNQTSNEESGSNQTSNEESSPSAAEETSCDSPINAQVRETGIAAQQDETSELLSEALTPRKRGRISSGSGENVGSRKQRKMLASGDEHSNEESSPPTVGDPSYIHPGAASVVVTCPPGVGKPAPGPTGEASTSGHRSAVSDSPESIAREHFNTARELLSNVFLRIEDSDDGIASIARDFFHNIASSTDEVQLSISLTKYYEERFCNWNGRKGSLPAEESRILMAYEIFVRIVVQSLISIVSFSTLQQLDYYAIMLNYRNFSNFYRNFSNYWANKSIEFVQDEEIRNRVEEPLERIMESLKETKIAFRNMLGLVTELTDAETYREILKTYEKDLLQGDKDFLPDMTP